MFSRVANHPHVRAKPLWSPKSSHPSSWKSGTAKLLHLVLGVLQLAWQDPVSGSYWDFCFDIFMVKPKKKTQNQTQNGSWILSPPGKSLALLSGTGLAVCCQPWTFSGDWDFFCYHNGTRNENVLYFSVQCGSVDHFPWPHRHLCFVVREPLT